MTPRHITLEDYGSNKEIAQSAEREESLLLILKESVLLAGGYRNEMFLM